MCLNCYLFQDICKWKYSETCVYKQEEYCLIFIFYPSRTWVPAFLPIYISGKWHQTCTNAVSQTAGRIVERSLKDLTFHSPISHCRIGRFEMALKSFHIYHIIEGQSPYIKEGNDISTIISIPLCRDQIPTHLRLHQQIKGLALKYREPLWLTEIFFLSLIF